MAVGNVFLSELKSDAIDTKSNNLDNLSEYDWLLNAGPITSFLFFTKNGATAGVSGLLAVSE